ncbi:MAG: PHP domain-containing protein, partial [Thermoplasmata archaeon]|nr:PHP domain-containing protein [Thermoplasmata archaeon]
SFCHWGPISTGTGPSGRYPGTMSATVRLDLHIHSRHSVDSRLSFEQILERITYQGLQGFALTDHNTTGGLAELDRLRAAYPGFWFIPGVEVSTREGHLLAYGVTESPPPGRPLAETLERVAALGGVAVLAHPFRWVHGVGRRLATEARVDGIEGKNGKTSELANSQAELLAAHRAIASTGGSDAHEANRVGRAFTEFPGEAASLDDLLEQIRRGKTTAAGDSLSFAGRVRSSLRDGLLSAFRGFRPVGPRAAHPDRF